MNVPDRVVHDVAAAVALLEGESGVRSVLEAIRKLEPVSVRRVSRTVDLPVPIVAAVCGELRKRGIVAANRPVQLTDEGRRHFGHGDTISATCPTCGGRELVVDDGLSDVAADLARIADLAPTARLEIDQSHCTVDTKIRRALLMHETGSLAGRRILLLGDDDLMSLAIERVARHLDCADSIRELVVVDIDSDVLEFCHQRLRQAAFRVRALRHDLRTPLPPELIGRFDVALTDPPYTAEGAELFLSRAVDGLGPRTGGSIFFSFGIKPPQESLRVQTAIASMGLVTRRLVRGFNEYAGSGALGGVSNLYHLTTTTHTRSLIHDAYSGPLYTGDSQKHRRYRCKGCGAVETVGPGQRWPTIRHLKDNGCPACAATLFRPLPRVDRESARRERDGLRAGIGGREIQQP